MKTITTKKATTRMQTGSLLRIVELPTEETSASHNARHTVLGLLLGAAALAMVACGGSYDDTLPVVERSLGLAEGSVTFDGRTWDRGNVQAPELQGRDGVVAARRESRVVTLGQVSDPHQSARQHAGAARQVNAELDQRQNASGEAPRVAANGQDFAPKKVTGTLQKSATLDEGAFTLVADNECPRWAPCRLCAVATGRCACIQCDKDDPMAPATQRLVPAIDSELESNTPSTTDPVPHPGGGLIDPPLN